jgi:hypothetical protein
MSEPPDVRPVRIGSRAESDPGFRGLGIAKRRQQGFGALDDTADYLRVNTAIKANRLH